MKNTFKMNRTHELIKLRATTVENLKRLMHQTGKPSIDELISSMIRKVDWERLLLKDFGWKKYVNGDVIGG